MKKNNNCKDDCINCKYYIRFKVESFDDFYIDGCGKEVRLWKNRRSIKSISKRR